jgi:hypothetical protein
MAFGRHEILQAVEQLGVAMGTHLGVAELAMIRPFDLAAQLGRHGLHAVADAQNRYARFEDLAGNFQRLFVVGRSVAARQDDALQAVQRFDEGIVHVTWMDFAVNAGFAYAASDKLGDL